MGELLEEVHCFRCVGSYVEIAGLVEAKVGVCSGVVWSVWYTEECGEL